MSAARKVSCEIEIKEPTVIYMERPLKKAEYTIHIEVPLNPFWGFHWFICSTASIRERSTV